MLPHSREIYFFLHSQNWGSWSWSSSTFYPDSHTHPYPLPSNSEDKASPPSPQAVPLAPCNCIWLVIPSRKYLQLLPLWLLHLRKKHKSLPFRDLSFDSALLCGWCTISFLFEQNFLIVESWTSDSTSSPPIHLSAYWSQPPAHESFANFLKVSSDYLNCQI